MTNLYYDGDSHSCALPDNQRITTGHLLAQRLGFNLEHYGFPGKSPAQIIRSAVRYSLSDQDNFMAIGVGVAQRLEYFTDKVPHYDNRGDEYIRWPEEDSIRSFSINAASSETQDLFDWQYMEVNVLFNLLQLHDYLSYNNKNFIINNLFFKFDIYTEFVFANKLYEQIQSRPRFVNIFENSLHNIMQDNNLIPWDYKEFKWAGHPDENGHAVYADYLSEYVNCFLK